MASETSGYLPFSLASGLETTEIFASKLPVIYISFRAGEDYLCCSRGIRIRRQEVAPRLRSEFLWVDFAKENTNATQQRR